ncbi:DUF3656 domain-containing protein [Desulfuromonas sp.]|uniref:DUF3656 domain-containing protein n=1 Tax=Desulfuromonas sp. TaxID=892 RepID=UPI0025C70EE7|nr:DUF3656 domain-containing protein [Desulfuromonas sp.]
MSDPACRRKLGAAGREPWPVRLEVGLEGETLTVRGASGETALERSYPVATAPATESPLSEGTLREVFAKTAVEPLALEEFAAKELPPVVIPPSRLKAVRRDFYEGLAEALVTARRKRRDRHRKEALDALLPDAPPRPAGQRQVTVAVRDLRDTTLLADPAVDRIFLPLTPANLGGLGKVARRMAGREDRLVWDLPFILFDDQWAGYRDAVAQLVTRGFTTFRLHNLGHFPLFDGLEGVRLISGYRLFILNSQAALAWKGLGVAETTLYIEDDRDNLAELLRRRTGLSPALTAYASVPLLTSRIAVRGVRPDQPVVSDRGDAYRVSTRGGLTIVRPEADFSLLGKMDELAAMGCGRFAVELAHVGVSTAEGKKILEALKRGREVPGTSRFNYEMGME